MEFTTMKITLTCVYLESLIAYFLSGIDVAAKVFYYYLTKVSVKNAKTLRDIHARLTVLSDEKQHQYWQLLARNITN